MCFSYIEQKDKNKYVKTRLNASHTKIRDHYNDTLQSSAEDHQHPQQLENSSEKPSQCK